MSKRAFLSCYNNIYVFPKVQIKNDANIAPFLNFIVKRMNRKPRHNKHGILISNLMKSTNSGIMMSAINMVIYRHLVSHANEDKPQ